MNVVDSGNDPGYFQGLYLAIYAGQTLTQFLLGCKHLPSLIIIQQECHGISVCTA